MAMLAMTIRVHFWVLMGPLGHPHAPQGPTCGTALQPSHLTHTRPASSLVWTVHGAFYVLCALTAHKPAHGHYHAHGGPFFFFSATEATQGPL
jgi:hypothetical protein